MEYQAPDAPVRIQNRHRIGRIDAKLLVESTKSIVSVDGNISKPGGGGKTDDVYPTTLSLAETIRQARDGLISEVASNQIHSPVGMNGIPDHVAHHRPSRRLGIVHEVAQGVSHPPAGAPGRRLPLFGAERLNGIRHSAAVVGNSGPQASLVVRRHAKSAVPSVG